MEKKAGNAKEGGHPTSPWRFLSQFLNYLLSSTKRETRGSPKIHPNVSNLFSFLLRGVT